MTARRQQHKYDKHPICTSLQYVLFVRERISTYLTVANLGLLIPGFPKLSQAVVSCNRHRFGYVCISSCAIRRGTWRSCYTHLSMLQGKQYYGFRIALGFPHPKHTRLFLHRRRLLLLPRDQYSYIPQIVAPHPLLSFYSPWLTSR